MARYIEIRDSKYQLSIESNETVTLCVFGNELELTYDIRNCSCRVLVFNAAESLKLIEKGVVIGSEVQISFVELSHGEVSVVSDIELYRGSVVNVDTTYLGINRKNIRYTLTNCERDTHSSIRNSIVALDKASFDMEVIGHITKEAGSSSCHQKNNCLTVEEPAIAKVSPILLIDNNDVEASHSLASGTIDDEIMFYINSRGLKKDEALKLLLSSYLIRDDSFYSEFPHGDEIKKKALDRVDAYAGL